MLEETRARDIRLVLSGSMGQGEAGDDNAEPESDDE
jgi:hypothetical protein